MQPEGGSRSVRTAASGTGRCAVEREQGVLIMHGALVPWSPRRLAKRLLWTAALVPVPGKRTPSNRKVRTSDAKDPVHEVIDVVGIQLIMHCGRAHPRAPPDDFFPRGAEELGSR